MCRLLAAHLSEGPGPLPGILRAFRRACTRDELHPRKGSHRDGWGWLVITSRTMRHYRTLDPVDVDDEGFTHLIRAVEGVAEGIVIAHCRRATKGMKKWLLASHPAPHPSIGSGYAEVWVALNGSIPLERLGMHDSSGYLTDTHLTALTIAERVVRDGIRDGVINGLRGVASAAGPEHGAVVAAVAIGGDTAYAAFLNHYPRNDPVKERYYRAAVLEAGGTVIAASPTIALYHGSGWGWLGEDEVVSLGEIGIEVSD